MPLMTRSCVALAIITAANKVLNFVDHAWPVEVPSDQLNSLVHSHMSYDMTVMFTLHNQFLESGIPRNPNLAFAVQHAAIVGDVGEEFAFYGALLSCLVIYLLPDKIIGCFLDNQLLYVLT